MFLIARNTTRIWLFGVTKYPIKVSSFLHGSPVKIAVYKGIGSNTSRNAKAFDVQSWYSFRSVCFHIHVFEIWTNLMFSRPDTDIFRTVAAVALFLKHMIACISGLVQFVNHQPQCWRRHSQHASKDTRASVDTPAYISLYIAFANYQSGVF